MRPEEEFFEVYNIGIVYISVCTNITSKKRIIERANNAHPTGVQSRWEINPAKTFNTGQPNPCPCNEVKGRKHYLLSC